jgi:beta-N-acetylhexosaminidase
MLKASSFALRVSSLVLSLLFLPATIEEASAAGRHWSGSKYSRVTRYRAHARFARAQAFIRPAYPQAAARLPAAITAAGKSIADASPRPFPRPLKILARDELLDSDPEKLARAGQHLIVGFTDFADVKKLVEKRAVGGVFITAQYAKGRRAGNIAADIRELQDIRKSQGLPRLVIAADQEGGYVSKLSPPLKWQPSLASVLAPLKTDEEREKAVRAYAEEQALALDSIGITMNFGPVVDLKGNGPNWNDGETRLFWRAIASDPYMVAKVAGWYCDTLTKWNIICTLKHFPGLGRTNLDTHVAAAEIKATEGQLELTDWLPFRRVMDKPGVATMLGHVRVDAIDKTTPASYSDSLIRTLMRNQWQNEGLLVTDDFSMGAVTRSRDGVGGAALKALNAGADFILLTYSEKYYNEVMSALIEAQETAEFNLKKHEESVERMKRYLFIEESKTAARN